jgi:hypothetical protein
MPSIVVKSNLGEMSVEGDNLGAAREAEYRFRHELFERRFAAMVLASITGKVPDDVVLIYPPKADDEGGEI